MVPRRIFTKRFLQISAYDQGAIVSAILQELESTIGAYENPIDNRQLEQRAKRIRARAKLHGITGV